MFKNPEPKGDTRKLIGDFATLFLKYLTHFTLFFLAHDAAPYTCNMILQKRLKIVSEKAHSEYTRELFWVFLVRTLARADLFFGT